MKLNNAAAVEMAEYLNFLKTTNAALLNIKKSGSSILPDQIRIRYVPGNRISTDFNS